MDNDHVDVEQQQQGPPEYSLADQCRLRRQSIRVIVRHTILLTMVPFGAMVVLSVYFRLISLDKVVTALLVTYAITAALLLYSHLICNDIVHTQDCGNWEMITILFYFALDMAAFLPFCSTFPHNQPMVLAMCTRVYLASVLMSFMFVLFQIVVIGAQTTLGRHPHPVEFGDNGFRVRRLSQVFASLMTCMFMCELANIAIAKAVIRVDVLVDVMM